MKKILILLVCAVAWVSHTDNKKKLLTEESENPEFPNEQFYFQRSYPDKNFDWRAYQEAVVSVSVAEKQKDLRTLSGAWTVEGPGNIGGRINTIAVHPSDVNTIYIGCPTGGIFKTTNGGNTWLPVFDAQPFLSIGHIAIDPTNPNIVYAGTGDPNISGFPYIGDGIYKSTDGGATWINSGLSSTKIISKILIDPLNTNIVYAGTMGLPFQKDNNRGLYKSVDGGVSWSQILFVADSAGIIDMVMNPNNPQIIYAASWNRIRNNQQTMTGGPNASIYKTINGGMTWTQLSGGLPLGIYSRIGLAISATNPNTLYATYINENTLDLAGIYKTTNGGAAWNLIPASGLNNVFGGFGWYFGKVILNPSNDNEIFLPAIDLWRSTDGGNTWTMAAPPWYMYLVHADKHDMVFLNPTTMLLATDGGLYKTIDAAATWTDIENITNTQFYRVAVNPHDINNYYGGAQDNGTTSGNASNINSWSRIYGGDGFQQVFNPFDPDIFFAETQNGGIVVTTDGGFSYSSATDGIDTADRNNWDMQYIMSSSNPDLMYTGTYRVYQNFSGAFPFWTPISGDLTDGNIFGGRFHTISTIAESSVNTQHLYAGTTDGNVWRSLNGGTSWDNVSASLPDRYVTSVKASPNTAGVAYVTHSGYKSNEFIPHIHQTTNNGNTWTDISGDMPQIAVNDILTYLGSDNILFTATDGGVYFTLNGGTNWERVGTNMPVIPVYDIELNMTTRKLIAGSHARSIMTFPLDSIILSSGKPVTTLAMHGFNIIQNPVNDFLNIYFPNGVKSGMRINILDASGKTVEHCETSGQTVERINVKALTAGMFFVKILDGSAIEVRRFLKM